MVRIIPLDHVPDCPFNTRTPGRGCPPWPRPLPLIKARALTDQMCVGACVPIQTGVYLEEGRHNS